MKTYKSITKQNQTQDRHRPMPALRSVAFFTRLTSFPLDKSGFSLNGIVVGIIIVVGLIIIG